MATAGGTESKMTFKTRAIHRKGISSPLIVNTTDDRHSNETNNRFWTPQISKRNVFFPETSESMPLNSQHPTLNEVRIQAERNRALSMSDLLHSHLPERQTSENKNRSLNTSLPALDQSRYYEAIPIYQVDRLGLILNRYGFNQRLVERYKSKNGKQIDGKRTSTRSKSITSIIGDLFKKRKGETPKKDKR